VEDYRDVTIMPALYKINTMVLAKRIREKTEGKRIVPQNQTGFRMGNEDNGQYICAKFCNK